MDRELIPLETASSCRSGFGPLLPCCSGKRAEVKKHGLWGPIYPHEHGGLGLDLVTHGLISEALGRCPFAHYVFGCNAPDAGNVELLHEFGTRRAEEALARAAGRGRDPKLLRHDRARQQRRQSADAGRRRAEPDGDAWLLNGRKWFTTGADGASVCIVMAVSDPDAPPHERASMFLVPTDTPGYRLLVQHAGHGGYRGGSLLARRDRVRGLPRAGQRRCWARVERVSGWRSRDSGPGRIHHCMRWLGICERALAMMIERAATRVIGPDGRRLGDSDIVRAWIAESAAEIRAARLLVLHTAWRIGQVGAKAARDDISMIKFHVAGVLQRVVDRALQVHGGLGMTDYTLLAWFYREERAARIYDGPDEVHKISVARHVLRAHAG